MGCYGIGVSRLLAAVIEQHHDEKGCIWTKSTAPFNLVIVVSNVKDPSQKAYAENLYNALQKEGIEVLLDDRDERYGSKMADFELLGIPYAVIVGKGLIEGQVELVNRANLQKGIVLADDILGRILEL